MTVADRIRQGVDALRRRSEVPYEETEWSELASVDDVHNCYRLLLGRTPDPIGFRTYANLVSRNRVPVDDLVARFVASTEFRSRLHETLGWNSGQTPQLVSLDGFDLYVDGDDLNVGTAVMSHGTHEPHVTVAIRRALSPGATFVDVGASIGYFSCLAGGEVGAAGHVFAFEPGPQNLPMLLLNLRHNRIDNARVYPMALSDRDCVLHYAAEGSNGSVRPFDGNPAALAVGAIVQAVALDDVLSPDTHVDVIKVDVEGAEGPVLLGARRCIERSRPVLAFEFTPHMLPIASGMTGSDLLSLLRDWSYELDVLDDQVGDGWDPTPRTDSEVMDRFAASPGGHIDLFAWSAG